MFYFWSVVTGNGVPNIWNVNLGGCLQLFQSLGIFMPKYFVSDITCLLDELIKCLRFSYLQKQLKTELVFMSL